MMINDDVDIDIDVDADDNYSYNYDNDFYHSYIFRMQLYHHHP
jgi:hypothetical protein